MTSAYYGKREKLYLDDLHWAIIKASHILHSNGIFDAYGHVSVRNPDNLSNFLMPRNLPPALLQSADDIVEYKTDDAEPVEKDTPAGFAERAIHSEIYKKFPGVNAIVHAHSTDVLPFTISEVPLKACIHTAGFLGKIPPVWDIASAYSSSDKKDLLVRTATLGHSYAASFKPETSTGFLYQKMKAALPTTIGGGTPDPSTVPDHPVVLMRGHGFTSTADSLEAAVYQAIYTAEAAEVQLNAITIHDAHFGRTVEGQVDVGEHGSGKIKSAKVKTEGKIKYLSDKEVGDAWAFSRDTMMRPWALWCREVEVSPLYKCDVKKEEEGDGK
ncbi:hypothetical protein EJ08DRAFT_638415 [Tothia fuscella]|uniref:Class II aldolase/adducin N-terminal domain-containing protein n=1 Tax=Tothia fuscella TaxID=1048955 RepID=A0A9P4NLJ8_9PEZI|nr:hypothetical protein EJ08DRAFT_638415 [Tothia fuscella]